MTVALLEAIELGIIDFDDLLVESTQAWTYYSDEPYKLCRFAADEDPRRDPRSLAWIWRAREDIWAAWPRGNYKVFVPGRSYWEPCGDPEAAKAAIRRWLARYESA